MSHPSQPFTTTIGDNDAEVTATLTMTNPGDPGNSFGRPADCYLGWAPEFEVDGWKLNGQPASEAEVIAAAGKPLDAVIDELEAQAGAADWSEDGDL